MSAISSTDLDRPFSKCKRFATEGLLKVFEVVKQVSEKLTTSSKGSVAHCVDNQLVGQPNQMACETILEMSTMPHPTASPMSAAHGIDFEAILNGESGNGNQQDLEFSIEERKTIKDFFKSSTGLTSNLLTEMELAKRRAFISLKPGQEFFPEDKAYEAAADFLLQEQSQTPTKQEVDNWEILRWSRGLRARKIGRPELTFIALMDSTIKSDDTILSMRVEGQQLQVNTASGEQIMASFFRDEEKNGFGRCQKNLTVMYWD